MLIVLYWSITIDIRKKFVRYAEVQLFYMDICNIFLCFCLSGVISLGSSDTNGFIKANSDAHGFYRVNYDINNWKKIIDHLNNSDFISMVRKQDRLTAERHLNSAQGLANLVSIDTVNLLKFYKIHCPFCLHKVWCSCVWLHNWDSTFYYKGAFLVQWEEGENIMRVCCIEG